MSEECCGNCRFWRNYACHVHPPIIKILDNDRDREWPTAWDYDWCGKWESKIDE